MRTKMTAGSHEATLTRLLDSLAEELLQASDQEILDAAADLGMNPLMRGSAAFFGLKYSTPRDFSEFFDLLAALPAEHPQSLARLRDKKGSREN